MSVLDDLERAAIVTALRLCGGRQDEATRLLRVSPRVVHYQIKRHAIDWKSMRFRPKRLTDEQVVANLDPEFKALLRTYIERLLKQAGGM